MPLVPFSEQLKKAQNEQYALLLVNVFEVSCVESLIQSFENKNAPGIIGMYSKTFEKSDSEAFVAYIKTLAGKASVPLSLMLDHGDSVEQCIRAIDAGFTDVMYDGSQLSYEENCDNTCQVVQAAHARGVGVEAELGHVGLGSNYSQDESISDGLTEPEQAQRFAEQTDVDLLAVAIGTAHGLYKSKPRLHIDLLSKISQVTPVPLALHGGTGLSEKQFRDTIENGICKINVATDTLLAMRDALRETSDKEGATYFTFFDSMKNALIEKVSYYINLFGATNKA